MTDMESRNWRLENRAGLFSIVRTCDLTPQDHTRIAPESLVSSYLDEWLTRAASREKLFAIAHDLAPAGADTHAEPDALLARRVFELFRNGRLVLLRAPASWLDVRVTDRNGRPLAGRHYLVRLPDGTERSGVLGEDGRVFIHSVAAGIARLLLVDNAHADDVLIADTIEPAPNARDVPSQPLE